MKNRSLPQTLLLMQGNTLLATLKRCEPVEMFWLGCEFEPTDAFTTVESLFRQATESAEDEIFDTSYEQLETLGVYLLDVDGNQTTKDFIMHIRENSVNIRFNFGS